MEEPSNPWSVVHFSIIRGGTLLSYNLHCLTLIFKICLFVGKHIKTTITSTHSCGIVNFAISASAHKYWS